MKKEGATDSHVGRGGGALSDAVRSCLVVARQDGGGVSLDTVTLTALKTTHAKEGASVSWNPVVVPGIDAIRLQPHVAQSRATWEEQSLLAYIEARGGVGVTSKELHVASGTPALSREPAKAALKRLVAQGRLAKREEKRRGQRTEVFYVPGNEREVA